MFPDGRGIASGIFVSKVEEDESPAPSKRYFREELEGHGTRPWLE
jgi:hypothetical protein